MGRDHLAAEIAFYFVWFALLGSLWRIAVRASEFDLQSSLRGEQNKKTRAFGELLENFVRRRFRRIALHLSAAHATDRGSHAGVKQSQIIIDFGLGGHG